MKALMIIASLTMAAVAAVAHTAAADPAPAPVEAPDVVTGQGPSGNEIFGECPEGTHVCCFHDGDETCCTIDGLEWHCNDELPIITP